MSATQWPSECARPAPPVPISVPQRHPWPRPTLLGKSTTCGKAVPQTTFEGQGDRVYASGDIHACGVGDGPPRLTQQSHAKRIILVQAYSFTSAPIAKALLEAHKRGIQVQVILDKSQRTEKYSSADFLANQGVPTMIDANHAISHNKVMIIDGETVISGSFNFTKAAQEKNAENVLIIRDKALAAQYTQNWEAHRQHSQPYVGRGVVR
jgi:phosphatidylserine/phosphatidylglycerophosphate/cardiolipin synthase-like enzyme